MGLLRARVLATLAMTAVVGVSPAATADTVNAGLDGCTLGPGTLGECAVVIVTPGVYRLDLDHDAEFSWAWVSCGTGDASLDVFGFGTGFSYTYGPLPAGACRMHFQSDGGTASTRLFLM